VLRARVCVLIVVTYRSYWCKSAIAYNILRNLGQCHERNNWMDVFSIDFNV
jgi:hypothetical protein